MLESWDSNRAPVLEALLSGLLGGLVLVDLALLGGLPAPVRADSLRLLLAVGAFGVVGLGLALGVVRSRRYAVGTVASIPLVVLYVYTGLLLPWTQLSYSLGQAGLEMVLGVPVVGEPLSVALFGDVTLTAATLQAALRYHYAVVGLWLVAALAIAVSLLRRRSPQAGRGSTGEAD